MSTFVFGTPDHAPTCRQVGGHPPVLCGCRLLAVMPASEDDVLMCLPHSRVGTAVRAFFRSIDRKAA